MMIVLRGIVFCIWFLLIPLCHASCGAGQYCSDTTCSSCLNVLLDLINQAALSLGQLALYVAPPVRPIRLEPYQAVRVIITFVRWVNIRLFATLLA